MSFERLFKSDMLYKDFNKKRYTRRFKERANISKIKLDTFANVRYLNVNDHHTALYDSPVATRYVAALNMSYDLLMSVYDVDTKSMIIHRLFGIDQNFVGSTDKYLRQFKNRKPNVEVRLIGMQDNEDYNYLYEIAELLTSKELPLVEVDLFGAEQRHIAIDAKLGMSFNVLMEDRIYRAGELANTLTLEQFQKSLMKAP